jgi:5'-methylthioadenosine phosphorylase
MSETRQQLAEIGVFGGSGFYSLMENREEVRVETPYGPPSDALQIGEIGGRRVAFLPRHGSKHQFPAHVVNYRANVWAMWQVGVSRLIGPCAAGSLQRAVKPGDFVICDQFVDRTKGRADTYYTGPEAIHVSTADPYCPELRALAAAAARGLGIPVHEQGTVVVIQGPRFSTRAESRWFSNQGWEVINMTQYPEATLARELELCFLNVSLITDYDAGVEGEPGITAVTVDQVIRVFNQNNARLKELLDTLIPRIPQTPGCACGSALEGARL